MPRWGRDRIAVVAALVAPFVVALALVPARDSVSNTNVALILVVVIVAVAANGHRLAGALAALSAAVWFDFFFTLPYQTFAITKRADLVTTVLLLAVGLAVSQLAAYARRLQVITITDAGYLNRIHDTAKLAQTAASPREVIEHVKGQLIELLNLRDCRFEHGTLIGRPPRLEPDGSIVGPHGQWDVDRLGLPDQDIELRTFHNGAYYGRFLMRPGPGPAPPLQARLVAVTLADQVSATLDNPGIVKGRE
ncbi:DUF4118 domain-containing protein [Catellatospora paridis]|uniref:DUF4118 domain-containing protein n=1 Tax=Catellatospora paridis TaxID=1617086 RepID=UPI0012D4B1EE|nr:DUF4118 domain-containing protein [Catellatospora paridis]